MKKLIVVLLLVIILSLSIVFINKGNVKTNTSNIAKEYNFTFICPILSHEYWTTCIKGIKQADEELGTTTKILGPQTPENVSQEMISYMRQAIEEKPDGIIVYAGIEAIIPLIDEATERGIPVITIDSDYPNSSRLAYVGTNAYNSGYEAGEKIAELTNGKAKIGILASTTVSEKEKRLLKAFSDATHDYDIEIVAIEETHSELDVAEEKAKEMLKAHPEINAILSTTGYNVTGAARVKKELKRNDLVLIGFDGAEENKQYIQEGIIDVIYMQRIQQAGVQSVHLLKKYLDGDSLFQSNSDIKVTPVTKDNIYVYTGNDAIVDKEIKNVRIGYYTDQNEFQNGFNEESRKSGFAYEYYQSIADITGWDYEYVYGTRQEIIDLLEKGEVDIVAGIYKTNGFTNKFLFSENDMGIHGTKRYFVVNKDRQDLLDELNFAMYQISQETPNYTNSLFDKYYGKINEQILTASEQEWIKNKKTLKVGYVKYHLPLSDQGENGEPVGVIAEFIEVMKRFMHITIEPVCCGNIIKMDEALKNGEIDVAFPVYADRWLNESKGFKQTDTFINERVMIVYTGNYSNDLMKEVALSRTGIGQRYYMEAYYPDSKINFYDSRDEVFKAIESGKERCVIGCSSTLQHYLQTHSEYNNLKIAYLNQTEDFGMAVRESDTVLLNLLNKTIRQTDSASITSAMVKYSDTSNSFTLIDILKRYALVFIGILVVFITFLVLIFYSYHKKTQRFKKIQLKTNNELERAVKTANFASDAKTNFLSSMSHDIRTPMNAIMGMTTIAYNNLDNKEKLVDCLEKIDLSSQHLLTLINNILDISKIESGKLQLNPIVFSLKETIITVLEILTPQVEKKNIELKTDISNLKYDILYGDEVRINQIFMNILSNAIKYTNDGGKISLYLSTMLLPDEKNVRITYIVQDTGIGMSEDFMKNMYDTFARAEDSRINKIQGTGLGLAIVKQMVDMMKGTIDCASQENVGTEFVITIDLPTMSVDDEAKEIQNADDIKILTEEDIKNFIEGKNFLIAEDNDLNWEIISELLSMYNINVERAVNGKVCLEKLTSAEPGAYDLILMDIQMPIMDGREATTTIRNDSRDYIRNIPIIAMTADAFAEDMEESLKVGMNGYVSKPVNMDKLFQEIIKVLTKDN